MRNATGTVIDAAGYSYMAQLCKRKYQMSNMTSKIALGGDMT